MKNFAFPTALNLRDAGAVRDYCTEINQHFADSKLGPNLASMDKRREALFEAFDSSFNTERIYRIKENGKMVATRPGSRAAHYLWCCSRANRLRAENSAMFAFPLPWYLQYRRDFDPLIQEMPSPLMRHGPEGIWPPNTQYAWLDFFLNMSIQHEIARGMMFFDLKELAGHIRPYIFTLHGPEHGLAILQQAVRAWFEGSKLSEQLIDAVRA